MTDEQKCLEWLKHRRDNMPMAGAKRMFDIAISALEKQIPKKPVIGYAFPDKLREVMKRTDPEKAETKTDCCPVCGRTLGVSKFVQTQTGLRFGDPHCKRCGQAIDWEEE